MANEELDSGRDGLDEQELPKPVISDPSTDKQTSVEADDLEEKLMTRLESHMEKLIDKRVKSIKDKRWDRVEEQYGALSDLQQALADVKAGKDPDEVLEAIEMRNIRNDIAELKQTLAAPTQQARGAGDVDEAWKKAKALVEEAGLTGDRDVVETMSDEYESVDDFLFAVNRAVLKKTAKPQPSPAGAVQPGGRAPSSDMSVEEATEVLNDARSKPRSQRTLEEQAIVDDAMSIIEEAQKQIQ